MKADEPQRVFFALCPGAAERARLAGAVGRCVESSGGRAVSADKLHVTLAFIGAAGRKQVEALRRVGAAVEFAPFVLRFDRIQYRRRQAMVWIGCRATPAALADLVSALRDGLARCGFRVEARPFAAHVTAVRRARRAPRLALEPIDVELDGFFLMRSIMDDDGVRYERIDGWPARANTGRGLGRPAAFVE